MAHLFGVLADTDPSPHNLRAVELHRRAVARGIPIRTVALGPGRTGGLDPLVPVLAPSTRSIAARRQLRRELRWADVVLAHGPVAARVAQRAIGRHDEPRLVVLDEASDGEPDPVPDAVLDAVLDEAVAAARAAET